MTWFLNSFGWTGGSGGGGGGGCDAIYPQTLFVSPDGDDGTAQKGKMCFPYKTIEAAKNAAVAGDTIEVFSGDYTINEQLGKDGISYYFHPQTNILTNIANVTTIFDDTAGAFNCKVFGYARFVHNPSFAGGFAWCFNSSNLQVECQEIVTQSGAVVDFIGGSFQLKAKRVSETLQYGFRFQDASSRIELETLENVNLTNASAFISNFTTTAQTHYIKIGKTTNNGQGIFGAISIFDSVVGCKIFWEGDIEYSGVGDFISGGISYFLSGYLEYTGNLISDTQGISMYYSAFIPDPKPQYLKINNSLIQSKSDAHKTLIFGNPEANIYINDSDIRGKDPLGVIQLGGFLFTQGKLRISDSRIFHDYDVLAPVSIIFIEGGNLLLNQVSFYSISQSVGSYAINSSSDKDIRILTGGAIGNIDSSPNITNIVAGTNYIYDSTLIL